MWEFFYNREFDYEELNSTMNKLKLINKMTWYNKNNTKEVYLGKNIAVYETEFDNYNVYTAVGEKAEVIWADYTLDKLIDYVMINTKLLNKSEIKKILKGE